MNAGSVLALIVSLYEQVMESQEQVAKLEATVKQLTAELQGQRAATESAVLART